MESAPCVGASCVHAILELLCSENVASESKSLLKMLRDGAARLQPAPKADPPPLPLAEAQEKAQSFRRRKLSYDTMDPNAITTDGKVDEPDATGSTAEAGSESFAAVKIAIEGESAIVSIDTSPTARSSPAKQHATQPARSSPLAG